jgi:hypothetical protein
MSQEENTGVSMNWPGHLDCEFCTGEEMGSVLAEENTNKLKEMAATTISRSADFFIGIQ